MHQIVARRRVRRLSRRPAWLATLVIAPTAALFGLQSHPATPDVFAAKVTSVSMTAQPGHHENSNCSSCHHLPAELSHPMGMPPAQGTGAGLPLVEGRIGCITCHDTSSGESGAMLRGGSNGIGLCLQCHQGSQGDRETAHALGIPWAHLKSGRNATSFRRGSLDSETQNCLECHDGTIAGDAGAHARTSGPFSLGRDHPIGMPYRSRPADLLSEAIDVVPISALDHRIRLFDRMVGCGSCHNVYSQHNRLLALSNQGSQLCLKCHTY